jgi:hypothetical protein
MAIPKEAYLKAKEKCKKNNLETESWKTTWRQVRCQISTGELL